MPLRACPGKFWAMRIDGDVVELGKDEFHPMDAPHLTFYDTEALRDAESDVIAHKALLNTIIANGAIEADKSPEAYAAKYAEATALLDGISTFDPLADPQPHRYVAHEMQLMSITWQQAAQGFVDAHTAQVFDKEVARRNASEALKSS